MPHNTSLYHIIAKPNKSKIVNDATASVAADGNCEEIIEVRMFNVGKGEAILIIFPSSSTTWLVDGGSTSGCKRLGEKLTDYLKQRDLTLEVLLASHRHKDHFGAVEFLLRNPPKLSSELRYYYVEDPSGVNDEIPWLKSLQPVLDGVGAKQIDLRNDHKQITIDNKGRAYLFAGSEQEDYTSIFMHLKFNDATMLFTGDAKMSYEKALLGDYEEYFRSDVLKITHHGSETGTSKDFVKAVKPAIAIASTASTKDHRLEVVVRNRLPKKCKIFETVVDGDITIMTAGQKFQGGVLYEVRTDKDGIFNSVD